ARVAAYVLTLPMDVILHVHDRVHSIVRLKDVRAVAASRVTDSNDHWRPPLPEWMAPFVVDRLRHCDDAEARVLYDWFFSLSEGSRNGNPFELAVARFKLAVNGPPDVFRYIDWWTSRIGKQLSTGASWKTGGRDFIALCMDLGKGFPFEALQVALASAAEKDGASAEKHRQSILRKVHDVTATLLVERAEAALKVGDFDTGDLFLSAFTSLDPGSFIGGAVHHLRKIPNLPPRIIDRIGVCEELAGVGARKPSEGAIFEAFLVLTRQVP
ncbi:MAG: hypothetical protein ACREJ3_16280, partial [Polyangiaceae bacterium]